jgi:hypothetical protein
MISIFFINISSSLPYEPHDDARGMWGVWWYPRTRSNNVLGCCKEEGQNPTRIVMNMTVW